MVDGAVPSLNRTSARCATHEELSRPGGPPPGEADAPPASTAPTRKAAAATVRIDRSLDPALTARRTGSVPFLLIDSPRFGSARPPGRKLTRKGTSLSRRPAVRIA